MELNTENVDKVVSVLRMGKFNEELLKVQNIKKIAEELIAKNPTLSAEEIGKIYEEQCKTELTANSEQEVEEK